MGMTCNAAWEESGDTCAVKSNEQCDTKIASSDAICECKPNQCDESKWPDKDKGLVCSDCKVLVDKFDSKYKDCNGSYLQKVRIGVAEINRKAERSARGS